MASYSYLNFSNLKNKWNTCKPLSKRKQRQQQQQKLKQQQTSYSAADENSTFEQKHYKEEKVIKIEMHREIDTSLSNEIIQKGLPIHNLTNSSNIYTTSREYKNSVDVTYNRKNNFESIYFYENSNSGYNSSIGASKHLKSDFSYHNFNLCKANPCDQTVSNLSGIEKSQKYDTLILFRNFKF